MTNLVHGVGGQPSPVLVLPLFGLLILSTLHPCTQNGLVEISLLRELCVFSLLNAFAFFAYYFSFFCPYNCEASQSQLYAQFYNYFYLRSCSVTISDTKTNQYL